eukprot:jgi/Tetstr1/434586/TSEL_023677.t1
MNPPGESPAPLGQDSRMLSFDPSFWDNMPEVAGDPAAASSPGMSSGSDPAAAVGNAGGGRPEGCPTVKGGLKRASLGPGKMMGQWGHLTPSSSAVSPSVGSIDSAGSRGEQQSAESAEPSEHSSQYRGVSYDKTKRRWRVQIKVSSLGKSGVSVGYFDTEVGAARAYDRAAIGLLGRKALNTNFPLSDYAAEHIHPLHGLSRDEVKAQLKTERTRTPKTMVVSNKRRTSRYLGVGSSNRKDQWQARILIKGKVTHLGYYASQEEAARIYDRVCLSLHGPSSQINFPIEDYKDLPAVDLQHLSREDLQRSLGVKPMEKSSQYRGVSRKKDKWEAKVMLHRKWAYRELFDDELDAARAYDKAVWRLKPLEAKAYVNFMDEAPGSPLASKTARATPSGSRSRKQAETQPDALMQAPPKVVTTNYRFAPHVAASSPRALDSPPCFASAGSGLSCASVPCSSVLESAAHSGSWTDAEDSPSVADERPPVSMDRDNSMGTEWLASLANLRNGTASVADEGFSAAAAEAIQQMGYPAASGAMSTPAPPRPQALSLEETMAARSDSAPVAMPRHGSVNSQVLLSLRAGLAQNCRLALPRPGSASGLSSARMMQSDVASPRVLVSSTPHSTCHLDFPPESDADEPSGDVFSQHCVARSGSASMAQRPASERFDADSTCLLRDLVQRSKSTEFGRRGGRVPPVRSDSMEQRDLLLREALGRAGLPTPRPTVTTGMQNHSLRSPGSLLTEEEEEILASRRPMQSKLQRCNSLVAQEVLISRSLSSGRAGGDGARQPLHRPSALGPRGAASAPGGHLQRHHSAWPASSRPGGCALERSLSNPRARANQGIMALLSRMGSHVGGRLPPPHPQGAGPPPAGWPVVSGVPLLQASLRAECAPLSAPNSDAARESFGGGADGSSSSDEEGPPQRLRAFASHDGSFAPHHR